MKQLGAFIKQKREALLKEDRSFSQLQVSKRIGIEQSYLSKIERGVATQLSEEKIVALAEVLGESQDYLLALGGKVSGDVLAIITQRPRLFSRLVRNMKNMSEDVIEADLDFKQRQSRANRLYRFASIGFFHLEDESERSMWSSHMPRILRLPPDAVPSLKTLCDALSPAGRELFIPLERESFRQRKAYDCELLLKGEEYPRFVRIWGDYEILHGKGGVVRMGLIQDVTKEVQFREELRRAHQTLSGRVEKQNEQIACGIEELKSEITARRKLEAELREVNEKIAIQKRVQRVYLKQIAYELRSLVAKLEVDPKSLQDKALSCRLGQILATINNMNDFFEIKAGISLLAEPFEPRAAFERLISDIKYHIQLDSGVELQLILSPNLPARIIGDLQRLQQIMRSVMWFLLRVTEWGTIQFAVDYLKEDDLLSMTISTLTSSEDVTKELFYPDSRIGLKKSSWMLTMVGPLVEALGGQLALSHTPSKGVWLSVLVPSKSVQEAPKM